MTSEKTLDALGDACRVWQTGRDGGSSLLRGAGRVLTGVPHYFEASFISQYEEDARRSPYALRHAQSLLSKLATFDDYMDATAWTARLNLAEPPFVGRGVKTNPGNDEQILRNLRSGQLSMPLWGMSLDRSVAEGYGKRFLFEIVGNFPSVASWTWSHFKGEELELILGGKYTVLDMTGNDEVHVRLRWTRPIIPVA